MPPLHADLIAHDFAPLTDDDRKRVARRMTRTFSGSFTSIIQGASLPWHDRRELEALSLFELDHRVESIEMRPERVTLIIDGCPRSHIPAFRLRFGDRSVAIDVLGDAATRDPSRQALTDVLTVVYAARGMRYTSIPHAAVRAQPRLRNSRLVLRARNYEPGLGTEMAILSVLSTPVSQTLASIVEELSDHPNVREAVYSLVTRRRVAVDLWAPKPEDMAVLLLAERGEK